MNEKDAVAVLSKSEDFRVLTRFKNIDAYSVNDTGEEVGVAFLVDTETTGLDVSKDKIFEFGGVLFEYGLDTGRIFKIIDRISELEDPGVEIPPEIVKLTHIDPEELKGKKFNEKRILDALAKANLVIAHNSGYDRPMLERRFVKFEDKPWACSLKDVKWNDDFDIPGGKLDYIAFKLGFFFDGAHRADNDCAATVHVLAQAPKGRPIMSHLLENARLPSYRVWAVGSPFETKDMLKKNGYYWSAGDDGRPKSWFKDVVGDEALAKETEFLETEIYAMRRLPDVEKIDAMTRYSIRRGEMVENRKTPTQRFGLR